MKQGFVKVAAASCAVVVADVRENTRVILETIHKMEAAGAKVMVLPELALTGYTCSDLFWQSQMIDAAKEGLKEIAEGTKETDALIFVGLPWEQGGKLFNVAAVLCHGELLGVVPKKYLPNYNEFYELRHFTPGKEAVTTTEFFGKEVPFGMNLLFQCEKMPRLKVAAELCEDLWTPNPPSVAHALAGATVVVNLSASDEMVGKDSYRRSLVSAQSARLICGYIYATAGEGESTTDLVFGGQHLIAENGTILAEAKRFENQIICADLDVDRLTSERRRMTTYPEQRTDGYQVVRFSLAIEETKLTRYFDPRPFVPSDKHNRDQRCDEILNIQAMGLKKRLAHTHCQSAVIGISGGLDSTLALLVTVRTFDFGADRTMADAYQGVQSSKLGLRGIRSSLRNLPQMAVQICALMRAATKGPLRVMFPMVTDIEDWDSAMQVVDHCRRKLAERGVEFEPDVPFGVMLSIPAACLTAEDFTAHGCRFFVIGTNDLTQYTHAVSRELAIAEHYYRPASPAMKKLIAMVVDAAKKADIPVTICGLAVGNAVNATQYLRLGLRSFSMSPQNLLAIKKALRDAETR